MQLPDSLGTGRQRLVLSDLSTGCQRLVLSDLSTGRQRLVLSDRSTGRQRLVLRGPLAAIDSGASLLQTLVKSMPRPYGG
jgi:hypothetical protein